MPVAKPEWGVKRVCQSCAAKFYDLGRSPITCPKCAAPFDPEALLKSRRVPDDISDEIVSLPGDGDSDDDSVPVDASELGDDDVSVVVVPNDDDDS
jgi:uncharacterized protein (TIGR02300 family)